MRFSMLSVWIFLCGIFIAHSGFAQSPTISPWQLHKGNEGVLNFTNYYNGDARAYSQMNVPAKNDKGWVIAPLDANNEVSIKWGSSLPCMQQIDFTYFQTFVNIPDNYNLKSANISYNKADDGARIYIYNSKYPNGIFDTEADISIHRKNTANVNFLDKFAKGENRIIIVQFDDCGDSNRLEGIKVTLNGERIVPQKNTLTYGESISIGQKLTSKNGLYSAFINSEGSFCIYKGNQPIWTCGSKGGVKAVFESNGTFTLYNAAGKVLWYSLTLGTNCNRASLEDNGEFVISNSERSYWRSIVYGNTLEKNKILYFGNIYTSKNGQYKFGMSSDGRLCIYKGDKTIWSTEPTTGVTCKIEEDGTFVIYDLSGKEVWRNNTGKGCTKGVIEDNGAFAFYNASGQKIGSFNEQASASSTNATGSSSAGNNFSEVMGLTQSLTIGGKQIISKNGQYNLIVQPDGNICIYRNKTTFVWCAMTSGKGGQRLTFNADGNLCLYNASNQIIWETGTNKGSIREVGALLILDDQGVLRVMNANQQALWSSTGGLSTASASASNSGNVNNGSNSNASVSNANNTLNLNQELVISKKLVSNNEAYEFKLCGKGSLVIYKITNGKYSIDWFCGKSSGSRVKLEQNGNLVVYGANGASIWSSNTANKGVYKAVMEDYGDLVLYGSNGQVIWSCKNGGSGTNVHPNPDNSHFAVGGSYKEGEVIATSVNDQYSFGIRQGSLRVYNRASGQSTWSCGSKGGTRCAFESNGDIVLYDAGGRALWRSNTGGKGCTRAAISDKGEIIMYTTTGQQVSSFAGGGSNTGGSTASTGTSNAGSSSGSSNSGNTLADGQYRLWNDYTGSNKVLALNAEGKVYLADINNNDDSQVWIVSAYGSGYRRITNKAKGNNFSLDIVNQGNLDQVAMGASGNYSGQAWLITYFKEGVYRLTTQWQTEKKSLDVINVGNTKNVQLALSGNYTGQAWHFVTASTSTSSSNQVNTNCEAKSPVLKYQTSMKPGDKLQLNEKLVSANGRFQFRITSDGNYVVEEVVNSGACSYKEVYRFPIVVGGSRPSASYFSYNPDGNVCMESSQGKGFCLTDGRDNMVRILYKSSKLELTDNGILRLVGIDGKDVWTSATSANTVVLPNYFKLHAYSVHGKRVERGSDFYMGYTNGSVDGKIINPNSGTVFHIEKITIDASKGIIAFKVINAPQPNTYLGVFANKNVGLITSTSGNSHHFYVKSPEEKEAMNLNFASFESVAYPNWYLRHQGYVLKISEANSVNRQDIIYRQDASWLFESINK